MPKIRDLLDSGQTFSFEFFPPKTDQAQRTLEKTLGELEPLDPSYVSVTYGAGGSTREKTREVVLHIRRNTSMTAMAHLSCIAHSVDELAEIVADYRDEGIENILALAGDPPAEGDERPAELAYASELAELVRSVGDFSIGVAAHPELHPRSTNEEDDRRHLAHKLAIADFGITQFFFEPEPYVRMVDQLDALGCTTPVIPGIMPVTNVKSVSRMAAMSGATFPTWFLDRLDAADQVGPDEVHKVGVDQATELSAALLDRGVPGLHFYTLNRSPATSEIYRNLGLPRR